MIWQQIYDPFGNMIISTALAAIPVVVMLYVTLQAYVWPFTLLVY